MKGKNGKSAGRRGEKNHDENVWLLFNMSIAFLNNYRLGFDNENPKKEIWGSF